MEIYRNRVFDREIERNETIREKAKMMNEKRNKILLELGIEQPDENLKAMNAYEIIIKKILEPIFKSRSTKEPNPEIIEELSGFKYADIFARFPQNLAELKKIEETARIYIDKTMDWLLEKFGNFKNKEDFFSICPLKAYLLEKNNIPICSTTCKFAIDKLLEKKNLIKKAGFNPNVTTYYNWGNEKLKNHTKEKEPTEKIPKIQKPELKKNEPEIKKENPKNETEKTEKEKEEADDNIDNANMITFNIEIKGLPELNKNIKILNGNMKNCMDLFEKFSEKF
jgi:hypothetical protein